MIPGGKEKLPVEKIVEIDLERNYSGQDITIYCYYSICTKEFNLIL
jgi:hypothetical protein